MSSPPFARPSAEDGSSATAPDRNMRSLPVVLRVQNEASHTGPRMRVQAALVIALLAVAALGVATASSTVSALAILPAAALTWLILRKSGRGHPGRTITEHAGVRDVYEIGPSHRSSAELRAGSIRYDTPQDREP